MKSSNFDKYLKEQLKDEAFARRFHDAGEAWDISVKIAALRREAGLTQQQLAERMGTTQQQISRLESPSYEGHSLSMLRRIAGILDAEVHVTFERAKTRRKPTTAGAQAEYRR